MRDPSPHSTPARKTPTRLLRDVLGFAAVVFVVGVIRFGLTVSGVDDSITRWVSMTAVLTGALLYFGAMRLPWRPRLVVAYLLILPYMLVEVAALGYTWLSGRDTIFHAEPYTLGTSLPTHFWGHLIGGLTFEPVGMFLLMTLVGWGYGYLRLRRR